MLEYSWYLRIWNSFLLERYSAPTDGHLIAIDISKENYILHRTENSYHRLHCRAQRVPEWCCIAHCSSFMPFIHCRHNFVIYGVSKHHKHHSIYPSMCHWYEPGYFAKLSQSSNSTPLSHTRLNFTDDLVWIKCRSLQTGRSLVQLPMKQFQFFIDLIHSAAFWSCDRLSF